MTCDKELIVVQRIGEGGNVDTRGTVISSNTDLKGETFGLFGSLTPNASVPQQYFNASARVNADLTATISPLQYWPGLQSASMKFFSWYPFSDANAPTTDFSNPGQMVLNYTANAVASGHVDVLAAVSGPAWVEGVNIHFYHTLTKVTFTFKKVAPAPDVVTIEKIEFRNVGTSGKLTVADIPAATTEHNKPDFIWSDVTTGNITSIPVGNKMVTDEATLIGDTFLMLPTDAFPATAKIIITTNCGEREFLLKDIVDAKPHAWESGEYINYNITVSNENYQFTATPLEWTDSPVNVIFDKQYYLRLSQNKVLTARNAATVNIEVKTNYDANPYTGYPVGVLLDDSGMETWATVHMNQVSASEGVMIAFLQVQSRRKELRTMRSVGADSRTAYWSLYWEQLMLAALGAVLGAGLCLALGWGTALGLGLTAAFAVLWLLGAHVALRRANSRHILKNRREVE